MKNLIIIIFGLFLVGCLGSKKVTESSTTSKEKTEIKSDSTKSEIINKAIDDSIGTKVQSSGDAETDAKIDAILSTLNTSKTSGDNSYRWYYDEKLRELKAEFQIGETKDKELTASNESSSEKSFEENMSEYVKKIVLPWWAYVIAFVFAWPYLKPIIMMFLGPTNIITSISNAMKQKNENT